MTLFATAAAYIQTITYAFVFDDLTQIEMNRWIQSWRFWRSFFTGDVWAFGRTHVHGNYYRPVFLLWLTGNYSLFKLTPGWWHLTSVAAHVAATALVYLLASRLLRDRWTAVAAALLFGLYPLHIESVAWVSGIPDVLMTVFFLGAILAYQNWREGKRISWSGASVFLFALALMSKETALAFLPVIAVYEWTASAESSTGRIRQTLLNIAPYAAVAAVYLVVRRVVLSGFAISNYPRPLSWVLLSMPSALWFYFRQLCWPFHLSAFYNFDLTHSFSFGGIIAPLLVAAMAMSALAYVGRPKRLGWISVVWILAALLPVIAGMKVFPWHDYVHDRYLYLPSVMVAMIAAVGLKTLSDRLGAKWLPGNARRIQLALTALIAAVFAISTCLQSQQWESDLALFSHAHEVAPANPVPADYRARTLYGMGRTDEALAIYRSLLQADPNYWQANYVLGLAYYQMGRDQDAERYLKIAAQVWPRQFIRPEAAQFYYLGVIQQRMGEYADAESSLRLAVALLPDAVGYRNALGSVLQQLGRTSEAQEQFRLEGENRKAFAAREKEFPD